MRDEAVAELERVNDEIEALEARKEQLEAFLGSKHRREPDMGRSCNSVFGRFQKLRDLYPLVKSKTSSKRTIRV